ncbi:hypothetical protein ACFDR9_003908 [Janthinobacterium sp. CG_23.3]|uniref:hypothetical protein n=1 Tax=Janthinobacterium sp. CG_23.3 TaxID=3349634 RepID=UPI0038D50BCB
MEVKKRLNSFWLLGLFFIRRRHRQARRPPCPVLPRRCVELLGERHGGGVDRTATFANHPHEFGAGKNTLAAVRALQSRGELGRRQRGEGSHAVGAGEIK